MCIMVSVQGPLALMMMVPRVQHLKMGALYLSRMCVCVLNENSTQKWLLGNTQPFAHNSLLSSPRTSTNLGNIA